MKPYDLIIVGAGPAGMNAAVYAGRYQLKTLLIGELPGGLVSEAYKICNFLSYKIIDGSELVKKMEEQVKEIGIEIKNEKVLNISKKEFFEIKTEEKTYSAKKLVIATGSEKRKLSLPKEEEFLGKGISYCATCDSVFYQDKIVGVIGGGNSALKAALLLSGYAKKVYLIHHGDNFSKAEPAWIKSIRQNKKIRTLFKTKITKLLGKNMLEGIKLGSGKELKLEGLFVEIGSLPNALLASQLKVELENGFIKTDKSQKTNIKGLFAAGDVTNNPLKQIITAAAEGAVAATSAYQELKSKN